jgi:hypothetical protein
MQGSQVLRSKGEVWYVSCFLNELERVQVYPKEDDLRP